MKYYYCEKNGKVAGPASIEEIKALIFKGDLGHECLVCPEGSEDWVAFNIALSKALPSFNANPITSSEPKLPAKRNTYSPVRESTINADRLACRQPAIDVKFLITVALALVNAALLFAIFLSLPVLQPPTKYKYRLQHVDRETLQLYEKEHFPVENLLETYQAAGGWEYVGPLCNDGVNATWLLMRKPIKENN